jgi:hypothetical protein
MGSAGSESEDAELERGKALMKGDTLVIRFCLYGFLKSESVTCSPMRVAGPERSPSESVSQSSFA